MRFKLLVHKNSHPFYTSILLARHGRDGPRISQRIKKILEWGDTHRTGLLAGSFCERAGDGIVEGLAKDPVS